MIEARKEGKIYYDRRKDKIINTHIGRKTRLKVFLGKFTLYTCGYCGTKVRKNNLRKHIKDYHPVNYRIHVHNVERNLEENNWFDFSNMHKRPEAPVKPINSPTSDPKASCQTYRSFKVRELSAEELMDKKRF